MMVILKTLLAILLSTVAAFLAGGLFSGVLGVVPAGKLMFFVGYAFSVITAAAMLFIGAPVFYFFNKLKIESPRFFVTPAVVIALLTSYLYLSAMAGDANHNSAVQTIPLGEYLSLMSTASLVAIAASLSFWFFMQRFVLNKSKA